MRKHHSLFCIAALTVISHVGSTTCAAEAPLPKQPKMGFEGQLVDVSKHLPGSEGTASVGMRVDSVQRGTPAWKMGLEKGDILVSIDCWRFETNNGYRQALRAAGQRPSIILVDARSQKLVRRPCRLPHVEPSAEDQAPKKGESYQMGITLESDLEPANP